MKLLIFALLLISVDIVASSSFESNDLLYVWARNGLNVRSGPGTSYEVIDKLSFGDSVEFILESDIGYNLTALSNVDTNHYKYKIEKTQPYIMYGWWRKILTDNGKIGYTISQYLLDLKPLESQGFMNVPLKLESLDTLSNRNILNVEEYSNLVVKYYYPKNIVSTIESGGKELTYLIEFPDMTFTEVLVVMGIEGNDYKITRNWKGQLIFTFEWGMGLVYITQKNNKVVCEFFYSC